MKKNQQYGSKTQILGIRGVLVPKEELSKEDTRVPDFKRIVDRLTQTTSAQRDYIFAIKKKLDTISFIGGTNEEDKERPVSVTINDSLNEQLDYQDSNTKQLEIILNFLNTLV